LDWFGSSVQLNFSDPLTPLSIIRVQILFEPTVHPKFSNDFL
jgi:hypothetical protein